MNKQSKVRKRWAGLRPGHTNRRACFSKAGEKAGCLHKDGKNRESKVERIPGLGLLFTLI